MIDHPVVLYRSSEEALAAVRAANIDTRHQVAAARLALVYGLDPLLKHVVVIPGAGVYPTVAGLRQNAERHGDLRGISYRALTPDEKECFYPGLAQGDVVIACTVWRGEAEFTEFGMVAAKEKTSLKDRSAMARTRALGRALKIAYSLALTAAEELDGAAEADEPPVSAKYPAAFDRLLKACGGDIDLAMKASSISPEAVGRLEAKGLSEWGAAAKARLDALRAKSAPASTTKPVDDDPTTGDGDSDFSDEVTL